MTPKQPSSPSPSPAPSPLPDCAAFPAQKISVLIVDDEPLARARARRMLERLDDIQIAGEASSGREAIEMIEREQPDVVLLDIQMPGIDGLRVLEALDDPPAVIFSTAFEHHAVRAFELDAVDYLLKPYSTERLDKALDRVRRQFGGRAQSSAPPAAAAAPQPGAPTAAGAEAEVGVAGRRGGNASAEPPPAESKIPAENGLRIELVAPRRIAAARIEEGVVFLLLTSGERLIYAKSLNELEERLPAQRFFRASRQAIVNTDAIESFEPCEGGGLRLQLAGGFREMTTRRRARHLRSLIE